MQFILAKYNFQDTILSIVPNEYVLMISRLFGKIIVVRLNRLSHSTSRPHPPPKESPWKSFVTLGQPLSRGEGA